MPRKRQTPERERPATGYSFADVLKLTTATRSNLIHWTNIGLIKADIDDSPGPGYPRRFSLLNLFEAELTAAVNRRFRVPVTVLAGVAQEFRRFHRMSSGVYQAAPKGQAAADDQLSSAQRDALANAFVEELVRRDEVAVHVRKQKGRIGSPASFADLAKTSAADPPDRQIIIYHAHTWARYCRDKSFRAEHFYGLFLSKDAESDGDFWAGVADEPLDLKENVREMAIVINLQPVFDHLELMTGEHLL